MQFFGELVQSELFKNDKYHELQEKGELDKSEDKTIEFIQNIWKETKQVKAPRELMEQLQMHYKVFDVQWVKYFANK